MLVIESNEKENKLKRDKLISKLIINKSDKYIDECLFEREIDRRKSENRKIINERIADRMIFDLVTNSILRNFIGK